MSFLRKNKPLDAELSSLKARHETLNKRLVDAHSEVEAAMDARRQYFLNGNMDDAEARKAVDARVVAAQSSELGLEDALELVSRNIADLEAKLSAEKAAIAREAAAVKRSAETETYAICVTNAERAIADSIVALKAVQLPFILGVNVEVLAPSIAQSSNNLLAEMRRVLELGRANVESIRSGATAIPTERPPEPVKAKAEPVPVGERKNVLLTPASGRGAKWTEAGQVHTLGPYNVVGLPLAIAEAAIKHGHGIAADTESAKVVQSLNTPDHAHYHEDICVDLMKPAPGQYIDEHRDQNLHSRSGAYFYDEKASGDWVGRKGDRVGTASVTPPQRY